MGIYDRDYQRGDYNDRRPGFYLGGSRMMNTNIILVTVTLYVVQLMATQWYGPWYEDTFALRSDWYWRPWLAYQLLSYGFLHAHDDLWHLALNMLGLFFFGRDVELRYGRREYLIFYLTAIIVAGLVWTVATILSEAGGGLPASAIGASGGVTAVVILFAFNFPYRTVLFMFFLPMPMWVAAVIFVVMDALGAMRVRDAGNVAVTAHLGGALFAFLYYRWGGRLERLLPDWSRLTRLRPRPKLRVHDPDDDDPSTDSRVDEILKKIQEQGQESLTYGERRVLEEASKEYQKKRQ
ncbi:MAG: rhomboid family intramembrane serine protease [Pirellulales bacterium]